MKLNDAENIIGLKGHRSRHSTVYHNTILGWLQTLDNCANGDLALFRQGFDMIREAVIDNPWLPYAQYK